MGAIFEQYTKKTNDRIANQELFAKKVLKLLPLEELNVIADPKSDMHRKMITCINYIAGMTDSFALNLYLNLRGVTVLR